jgi:hypothetical protein
MTDQQKRTISYPTWLDDVIDQELEAGVADSRSEWFRQAAFTFMDLQESLSRAAVSHYLLERGVDPQTVEQLVSGSGSGTQIAEVLEQADLDFDPDDAPHTNQTTRYSSRSD